MLLRLTSPKKKWLIFNFGFGYGKFVDMFAEGWWFCLHPPQRINGVQRFKGINVRKVTKSGWDESIKLSNTKDDINRQG